MSCSRVYKMISSALKWKQSSRTVERGGASVIGPIHLMPGIWDQFAVRCVRTDGGTQEGRQGGRLQ